MLPTFKEVVEELFAAGLIQAIFATETLALGINMPARTVVLERLDKWDGEQHSPLTPGEYTQLTGRAGRRGIDVEGHGVVLWQPGIDPLAVASLAGTRTYRLNSSFQPSYNMAVNLVGKVGRQRAVSILESSFGQFQADRGVSGLARQLRRSEEELERLADSCDRGDFAEYAGLRRQLSALEKDAARQRSAASRAAAAASLEQLRAGDIIQVPGGRRAGIAVVLDPGLAGARAPRGRGNGSPGGRRGRQLNVSAPPAPLLLTASRQVRRLSVTDFPVPVTAIDRIRIPNGFSARSPKHRRDLAATVRNKLAGRDLGRPRPAEPDPGGDGPDQAEAAALRRRLREHPCHQCPDREQHARRAEQYLRLEQEVERLESSVASRSHVLARTFERVCGVLTSLGYLNGDTVTEHGRRLADLYTELDLLAAECLHRGLWDGLSPAELAAVASGLTFESRRATEGAARLPEGRPREVLAQMLTLWGELTGLERDHKVSFLRQPDLSFAWPAHAWARGEPLETVLGPDLTPGDFVRAVRQLIDVLGQIAVAASGTPLAGTAREAADTLRHGVVAYSSVG
jgi:ATP-dependent RNA helicase HelY